MVPIYPILVGVRVAVISAVAGGVYCAKVKSMQYDKRLKTAKQQSEERVTRLKELKSLNTK